MFDTFLLVGAITLILGYVFIRIIFKRLPPGPWGLPVLGCWPWMTADWHTDLQKLGKGYADIFTVYLLNSPVVVLKSTRAIQEAFYKNPNGWAGRPYSHGFALQHVNTENLFKDDFTPKFRARKKFAMTNLKKFGYGLPSIRAKIHEEIDSALEAFRKHNNEPFYLQKEMWTFGANITPLILIGRRFEADDEEFLKVLEDTDIWFTEMPPCCTADVIPILRFFPRKCVTTGTQAAKRLKEWFTDVIEDCRARYDPNNLSSFIDICINSDFDNEEILNYMFSLWGDGVDTTVATMRWWFYFIAHNLDVQEKAQEEIDKVLQGRQPTTADKQYLPYLEATLMESMRVGPIVPISLPLKTSQDVEMLGYQIPKDTNFVSLWVEMLQDPEVFPDPHVYKPERFILEDGSCDTKNRAWAGYAIGRRSCIGEPLARTVMFLFLTRALQHFTFTYPEGKAPSRNPADMALPGVIISIKDFRVIATPRHADL